MNPIQVRYQTALRPDAKIVTYHRWQVVSSQFMGYIEPMDNPGTIMFRPLSAGDTIAVVAPASHFDHRRFEAGRRALEQMGFRVQVPPEVFAKEGIFAGPDRQRAGLVNRLAAGAGVKALAAARGGYGSQRILEQLDYKILSLSRKPIIGFSDITVVLWAVWSETGVAGIHGPTLTTLAEADERQRRALTGLLCGQWECVLEGTGHGLFRPGVAWGPVVGGNLTSLCHLLGTRFAPRFAGCIVILEDCGEKAYRIDRMVFQMLRAGCFDGVAGLALGRFSNCDDPVAVDRMFMSLAGELDVPLLTGLPVGHQGQNMPFVYGCPAAMDAARAILRFKHPDKR